MTDDLVLVDDAGDYAVVTMNRPNKRNAISKEMADQLRAAFAGLQDHKVVVITGNGPAFCAGVDLGERATRPGWSATLGAHDGQFWPDTIEALRRHPAVLIAAVNGFALGGGLTLVNAAELAIAVDTALFGAPEMSFGSFPALSGPSTVKRLLPKHAAQLIFTASRVSADVALRWGLVNEVVAADQLLPRARELAAGIAGFDAATLAFGKRAFASLQNLEWGEAIDQGILVSALARTLSADAAEQR